MEEEEEGGGGGGGGGGALPALLPVLGPPLTATPLLGATLLAPAMLPDPPGPTRVTLPPGPVPLAMLLAVDRPDEGPLPPPPPFTGPLPTLCIAAPLPW